MRKLLKSLFVAAFLPAWTMALAANTVTSVSQVTEAVTLSEDVDYVVTSATPFTDGGSVNITNTDHAVLILRQIRPSITIKTWLSDHVLIKGEQAVNGKNCQVKMYAHGTIIMPYASDIKPLTVYAGQNFTGTSVNSFGLENDGGFMNTLTTAKLNNQIRSFKLKRGYMVTFSTRAGGRGYSRCFIADTEDLEVSSLPMVLDQRISSYRVFQWYDSQKKGVADYVDETANLALGSTWSYTWGTGRSLLPDAECVANHIYEDWPSPAACGSVTYTCHMKTNNEPGNSADDHPQDVATVLANWENLMRTGLRLCSESSHDGSMNHLRAFIDSIDARGWRCDLLDLHCYWPSGNFNNWKYYYDTYGGRPIWISEWIWGASWNRNGVFGLGDQTYDQKQARNAQELQNVIIPNLNNSPYVERYAYWNSEADFSKVYQNGLTTSGKYYASVESGIGHNSKYDKIPTLPRQYNPSNLTVTYNSETKQVVLQWHDVNGEYNRSMAVEVKTPSSASWKVVQEITPQEAEADYKVTVDGVDGYKYRIHVVDLKNDSRYTNEASAVDNSLDYGSQVTVDDKSLYLGGNRLLNGNFDMGFLGWTSGTGEQIATPYFQVVKIGGIDGGSYLQCYGNGSTSVKTEASTLWVCDTLKKNTSYYVSAAGLNNNPNYQRITTTAIKNLELNQRLKLPAVSEWAKQGGSFTTMNDTLLYIAMRAQEGKACLDNVMICELFDTKEEALADALQWERKRIAFFKDYNTAYPQLTQELEEFAAGNVTAFEVREAISNALEALEVIPQIEQLKQNANLIVSMKLPDYQNVSAALALAETAQKANEYILAADRLDAAISTILQYTYNSTAVKSPTFASVSDWKTKTGTYTGGDQRTATQAGSSCWNAWWSISADNTTSTMAVNQDVKSLIHGLYAVECKATTQHLCETDQHAFVSNATKSVSAHSPALPYGLLDLPQFTNRQKWQTLVTPYVYVGDGDVLNIGFEGSKSGAVNGSWMAYGDGSTQGDNREGWWCATDFTLRYIPMLCRAASQKWGTICLPDILSVPEGVTLYKIAGILTDGSAICLEEETDSPVAGVPYIFYTENEGEIPFYESGSSVTVPRTNYNGLRGVFKSVIRYPVGSLVLNDGVWTTTETAYAMTAYSAYIATVENLKGLVSWDGVTMPATGVDTGKIVNSLSEIEVQPAQVSATYNLYGQKVPAGSKGLMIRNGKLIFVK
ncbi:MAG: hypothetical protein IJP70_07435 [Bacteroidales bacterium]|nr:hypothetical protein [Bacteroidales bacterium]